MKKYLFVFILLAFSIPSFAQLSFTGSMGIDYFTAPDLKDYLNMYYPDGSKEIATFTPSVAFYGELCLPVGTSYDLGFEYVYSIYSYNSPSLSGGVYNLSLDQHKLTFIGYYVISGEGYKFKFGAGAGIRFASVDEEIYQNTNYKSTGFGFLTRVCGLTPIGKNIYANLGVEAGYDLTGRPSNGGRKITNSTLNKDVSLNSLYFGLKIGITYYF